MTSTRSQGGDAQSPAAGTDQVTSNSNLHPDSASHAHRYTQEQQTPATKGALSREDAALLNWPNNLQSYSPSLFEMHDRSGRRIG